MKPITLGKWKPDEGKRYMTVALRDVPGITAKIYKIISKKGYVSYVLTYSLLNKRKVAFFANPTDAKAAGEEAIRRIGSGEQDVLTLANSARNEYQRSQEVLKPFNVALDFAATEYAEARTILNGSGTIAEAVRFFLKAHAKELPRITVPAAIEKCLAQCRADGKSAARMHQLEHYLNSFVTDMNVEVGELTPGLV